MSALVDAGRRLLDGRDPDAVKPDKGIEERIKRGEQATQRDAALRNECMQFWRGNQFVYRNREGSLVKQGTLQGESGKPDNRIRRTRNLILDIVARELAAATQRVPSYDCLPSTSDPDDISAARLAEKVALYGYDAWGVKKAIEDIVWYAIVADEGFAWPYFDNTVGTPIGEGVATGEIKIRTFGANMVGWEPGVRFDDSPWLYVKQAEPVDQVQQLPGFYGVKLTPDANTSEFLGDSVKQASAKLVMVTRYLERPSLQNPKGRQVIIANKQVICPPEDYPCIDGNGDPVDEPVLHKLYYFADPDDDHDKGLVRHLLDGQRAFNMASNKQLEWMVLAMNPQLVIVNGMLKQRLTDDPGAVFQVMASNPDAVKWRQVPQMPPELATMRDEAASDMGRIAAQNDIPTQIEAGKAIATFLERDQERRANFTSNLAAVYSRLGRHCLYLAQRYYTEGRLLKITGEFGYDPIKNFRGADLRSQADIRVSTASIEPLTREKIEQKIFGYADRGWITPQEAMVAINAGTADELVTDVERDRAYANRCIQLIRGMDDMSTPPDQIPQARAGIDNHAVQIEVLKSYAKSDDYMSMGPGAQEALMQLIEQHKMEMRQEQAQEAQAQAEQAASLGMSNAAKPQVAPPLPSQRSQDGPPPAPGASPQPQGA